MIHIIKRKEEFPETTRDDVILSAHNVALCLELAIEIVKLINETPKMSGDEARFYIVLVSGHSFSLHSPHVPWHRTNNFNIRY